MVNPADPILSRIGEAQLVPGASTQASNKISANPYDPVTNPNVSMHSRFLVIICSYLTLFCL